MSEVLQYPCPCCGGSLSFDSDIQKMKCPYCDTEFDTEILKNFDAALKEEHPNEWHWERTGTSEWSENEEGQIEVFTCTSCGGELVVEKSTAATACPFCSNPVVLTGRLSGDLRPDLVIPFQINQSEAEEKLKKYFSGKPLLPKIFLQENKMHSVKGIYVPFWLFDMDADAHIRYRGTKIRNWSDSKFYYTETGYYLIQRGGSLSYEAVPIDGSIRMDDSLMESIEPFDLSRAVDFQTAYLSGFFADRYDISSDTSVHRANDRVRSDTENCFRNTVHGYHSVITERSDISVKNGKIRYALYPVWLFHTKWKEKDFLFAVNGQSGKIAGNLPVDWMKALMYFFGITFGAGILIALIRYFVLGF